ncbi:hypothetical protein [Papillibacter cinnamivorans]|uniref:Uncharacterized protein n=1 Tax=Papillibacter cinnamivorans DSM 12816 TaxID=1122930 RepID=A0A1W2AN22_9FIRM|nr:hypothetical protein [Papillibacter cinnamivorans]SMC62086.1 hypothetical protein SAMN02745168_1851 [Papillibacter cinnamivorans DSM 12816]
MFLDKMVTTAIPERVYTLCKIAEKKPVSNSDLKDKMEPDFLNNGSTYYSDYRNAAEELKLITISDNMVSLAVDSSTIKSIDSLRKYVNGMLEQFSTGQFYQVTKAYYSLDGAVLKGEKNVANMAPLLSQMINRPVDAVAMRAWRFWVSFLGLGYLQEMFVIPNADVFLKDIIEIAEFDKNRRYSFGEFISRIMPYCHMIIDANPANRKLNYGISNGLRALHDAGVVKLEHILDQEDIWNLYTLKAHAISNTVTNITICS